MRGLHPPRRTLLWRLATPPQRPLPVRRTRPARQLLPSRRLLLTGMATAVAGGGLVACTGWEEEPAGPTPVSELGQEVPAPSGTVSAVLDQAGEEIGVMLRDAEGNDIWADDFPYVKRLMPSLIWEQQNEDGADVLWVLSSDIGTSRISQTPEGGWAKEFTAAMPEEIEAWVRD